MTRRSAAHLLLALVYAGVYIATYNRYLSQHFDYAGFTPYVRETGFVLWSVVLTVVPVVLYRGVRGVAGVMSVLIYFVLYVPIVLTFALGSSKSIEEIAGLQLLFCASMCLLFASDWVVLGSPVNLRTRLNLMLPILLTTFATTVWVVIEYWGNLRVVSFGEAVYQQRLANAGLGSGMLFRYMASWLGMMFAPLCLAYGVVARRAIYFLAGTAACVVLYMATAAKISVLLPLVYLAFGVAFGGGRLRQTFSGIGVALTVAVTLLSTIPPGTTAPFLISSLLLYRTLGNGGLLTVLYYDFFTFFPQTNFTHVNVVGALLGSYPYGSSGLGQVIGDFFFNDQTNANANFWATDGIAAAGALGILPITAIAALLFVVINSVTRKFNQLFVALCFLPFTLSLLNTSLFSTLWSGGGFFVLGFFLFHRRDATIAASEPVRAEPLRLR